MDALILRNLKAKKATMLGFWLNAILSGFKLFAGFVGNSNALIADGIHSFSDFLTDIIVLIGIMLTGKPADDDHNYGHGKYETLATVLISVFLGVVGVSILKTGIENIFFVINGGKLHKPGILALIAAAVSIAIKESLFRYTTKVGKEINSSSLIANAWHQRSDAMSSVGTFIGVGGAIVLGERWAVLDPIAAIIVSIMIFKVGVQILMPAVNELIETSLNNEEREQIVKIISHYPQVEEFHHLRTRRIGSKIAVEAHLLVNPELSIVIAHDIATEVENDIKEFFGESSIVTIHIEPYNDDNKII